MCEVQPGTMKGQHVMRSEQEPITKGPAEWDAENGFYSKCVGESSELKSEE